jgi:adenylate cyclase class 2
MKKTLEIEVKIRCDNLDSLVEAGLDLKIVTPRHFEDNWLLDTADRRLFAGGAALRVRSLNGKGLVTYKGVVEESATSPLKVREEIETLIDDPESMVRLFERLEFYRSFRYQKYRTVYHLSIDAGEIEVVFDETPMGNFVEIEGDESRVLQAMAAAGLTADDIIRESYPELQAARCKERGIPLEDLVFE